jgi:hypothetical protein
MKKLIFALLALTFMASCSKEEDVAEESEFADESALPDDQTQPGGGVITAGEWCDLAHWDIWNSLLENTEYAQMPLVWSFKTSGRISVNIKNQNTENQIDVAVQLLGAGDVVLWESKTDNFGNAELWANQNSSSDPALSDLKLKVNGTVFSDLKEYSQGVNNLTINNLYQQPENSIDIAFVVDATGSMGDELDYLKTELLDIITTVKGQNPTAVINLGSVFYRDKGDDYVTVKSDFSQNITQTTNFIKQQSADGGGDFPEAVHTALDVAVNSMQWSATATSRVIFLVLDAPPHNDAQVIDNLHTIINSASKKGLKIVPVTASGIDKETEFLMRYISIVTNGTYVFITNHSGIGDEHLEPTVSEYEVEYLNNLIIRLITKYLTTDATI